MNRRACSSAGFARAILGGGSEGAKPPFDESAKG
jgi:hypothetical protein